MSGFRIFSIGNIPVHLRPWFILILLYWTMSGNAQDGLIWGVVVTFSILVHELGHAGVAQSYKLQPSILLHGLGGLCSHQPASRPRHEALIIAAGPGAGLVLGCLTFAFAFSDIEIGQSAQAKLIQNRVVTNLLLVNFFWSFVNLVPLWPLDGGQLFRLFLHRFTKPGRADKITHQVGLMVALVWVGIGYYFQEMFLMMLGGYLGYLNYQAMQGESRQRAPAVVRADPQSLDLLKRAQAAFAKEDYANAARCAEQLRSDGHLPGHVMAKVWNILAISSARSGEHRQALSYLKRAPETAESVEATIECLHMLGRDDELQSLLRSDSFRKLGKTRRSEILRVLNSD